MLGSFTRIGPAFSTPFWNAAVAVVPCTLDTICAQLDLVLTCCQGLNIGDVLNIINNNGTQIGDLLDIVNDNSIRIKLIQADIDDLRKSNKYWEDRNLLRQTKDEKTGRASFRNRRQNLGGDE